ncbi:hypothetical protein [Massilia mucilaginosa]|nr:hypothetical protein [Massilia mucilaginosa]
MKCGKKLQVRALTPVGVAGNKKAANFAVDGFFEGGAPECALEAN